MSINILLLLNIYIIFYTSMKNIKLEHGERTITSVIEHYANDIVLIAILVLNRFKIYGGSPCIGGSLMSRWWLINTNHYSNKTYQIINKHSHLLPYDLSSLCRLVHLNCHERNIIRFGKEARVIANCQVCPVI